MKFNTKPYSDTWTGTKNKVKFKISKDITGKFYVLAYLGNGAYNSLWDQIQFDVLETAMEYCENFDINKIKR